MAIGVPAALPVDFAIRNGLVNLNQMPEYDRVSKWFRPGGLIPFRYQPPDSDVVGDWALPETQDFGMLFYRTDILQELELEPPKTWEDVYTMLPRLQQAGMDFYYPPPSFAGGRAVGARQAVEGAVGLTPFLFQNGGRYYSDDGKRSALDEPRAIAGFREWTELYTNFRLPRESNFFTRFRTGEMPIGVAEYFFYVSFAVAAPEISGRWVMQPMPGHLREDGSIDRTSGGLGQAGVIFKLSNKQYAAWEFLKWWMSPATQERYGFELESLIGVEARWNTANVEALQSLPWPRNDIAAVLEQWSWFREQPVVLGGYFTGRHVLNAWNRVVLQGWNLREALEEAVFDINKELAKKQEEFGFEVDPGLYTRGGQSRYRPTPSSRSGQ